MGHKSSKMSSSDSPTSKGNQVIISASSGNHKATLIFLHGLGDTGHGWASTLAEIRPQNMRIICPTAPTMPVTLNSGFQMPAWFDLLTLDPRGNEDEAGIKKAYGWIETIISDEISAGIEPKNIILGGFSQGGALALYTGLTTKQKIGGILALSCWLPMHMQFKDKKLDTVPPIFQCHGDCDPVVPYKWGQLTSTLLKSIVTKHEFKTLRGLGHSSSEEELSAVAEFLEEILTSKEEKQQPPQQE